MPDRKPYAQSFLSERNTSGVMPDRKPFAQSFLWERSAHGVTLSRKLFANSFLLSVRQLCFNAIGNLSRIVSHLV